VRLTLTPAQGGQSPSIYEVGVHGPEQEARAK
jgi:hypothetical protein